MSETVSNTKAQEEAVNIGAYSNPLYEAMSSIWEMLNELHDNQVKENTTKYLPKTSGQVLDKKHGPERYAAYLARTIYYNFTKETVRNSKNTIVRKPAKFEVPKKLLYMLETFNEDNEDILAVLDDTYYEQIKLSRLGRVIDIIKENDKPEFRSILYTALNIPSWNPQSEFIVNGEKVNLGKKLVYVLLNETCQEIGEDGKYNEVVKYKILGLRYSYDKEIFRYYTVELKQVDLEDIKYFTSPDMFNEEYVLEKYSDSYVEPNYQGRYINYIPFTFINLDNLKENPDIPVLYDQGKLSIGLFQKNANYSEIEMLQTINTTVITGDDDATKPFFHGGIYRSTNPNTKVENIGFDGSGLEEVRLSQDNLKRDCQNFGGVEVSQKNTNESGKALETRVTLQTDKLRDISKNGVAGLVQQLEFAAVWMGLSKDDVSGEANQDFRTERATTEDLKKMGELWTNGEITTEDYYKFQYENLYTNNEYDDWLKKITEQKKIKIKVEEKEKEVSNVETEIKEEKEVDNGVKEEEEQ